MPSLDQLANTSYAKLLYIGDSGAGKTGSLTSLVAAGYKLRILDLDCNLKVLQQFVMKECPDKISNVGFISIRDKYVGSPAGVRVPNPTALTESLKYLDKWEDDTNPAEWGPEYVLVVDSLSAFGRASFAWAKGLNPTSKEPRQWYGTGQEALENTIAKITSDDFQANVIVISHVRYNEGEDGSPKGYANSLGRALGPIIPRYFGTLLLAETSGTGRLRRRVIRTVPTNLIDLKTPAPWKFEDTLPLESGLSTIFSKLKEL